MATRRIAEENEETAATQYEELEANEQPEDMRLAQLLADLGADSSASVTVYQTQAPGQRPHDNMVYMFKTTPDAFSLDELRDEYGGGKFRLFITKNGRLHKNVAVNIAPPKKPKEPSGQLEAYKKDDSEMWRLMMEKTEQQNNNMMQMLLTVLQGMNNNQPQQQQASIKDMVEAMTMLHSMAPQQQNNNQQDSMKMLMQGIELAKELGGGGDSQDNALSLIKETLKTFGEPLARTVMEAQNKPAPQVDHQQQRQIPHATAQYSAFAQMQGTQDGKQSDMNPIKLAIKPMINYLKAKAKQDKDPGLYAEVALDEVPDAYFVQFVEYIKNEGLVDKLVEMDPEINQFREWFAKLREEMIKLIDELENEEPEGGVDGQSEPAQNQGIDAATMTESASNGPESGVPDNSKPSSGT